jgi:4-hydroxy-tetrahydrodipicolinate synthase
MPSGPCRQPLGKMTKAGFDIVLENARKVYNQNPEILKPIENFFDVDLQERLYKRKFWKGLYYD